jgi:LPS sulfotransferase NodH
LTHGPLQQVLAATAPRLGARPLRKPNREFLILFLARTGSSHLAELLTSAGVGDVREWLNPAFVEGQARHFGANNFHDYLEAMRSICPNGVFGQKMTIWFYEAFAKEVRLEDHFNFDVPCVFLFRENIVEQAVSLCFADRRKVFHHTDAAAPALEMVEYDPAAICRYVEDFADEERRLQQFVAEHGAEVRYLSYEQLTETDSGAIVQAIAHLVDLEPALTKMKSQHRKIGDETNRLYAARFIEEELEYVEQIAAQRQWLFDAAESQPLI